MTGETKLVDVILAWLETKPTTLINVGAGHSPWVEYQLQRRLPDCVSDRIDVESPTLSVEHQHLIKVGRCWTGSIENMSGVPTGAYGVAYANYVLEHISDLDAAAREVRRILRPDGLFVASVPNPSAPQFRLAAVTPLWVHRVVRRGEESWPTVYAFRDPDDLGAIFARHGFRCVGIHRISNVAGYLRLWHPMLGSVGRLYDYLATRLNLRGLMGEACVVWEAVPA